MIKLSLQALSCKDALDSGEMDLEDVFHMAARLHMDGVDLEDRLLTQADDAYLENLRLLALRLGLRIGYIGVIVDFNAPATEIEHEITRIHACVDMAARMGVQVLRVPGNGVPPGETDESFWPLVVDKIRRAAEYGRKRGVVIGLHNHNHGAIPATGTQVVRMLDEIDSPYVSHILDTGQYRGSRGANGVDRETGETDESLYEHIQATAPRAVIARAKFYQIASGEEKWLDYRRIVSILRAAGFNGWISVVYEGHKAMPSGEAIPLAVQHLRNVLGEDRRQASGRRS